MANTGRRIRRRLSFPPVQEQTEDELSNCALCSGCYTSLYEPQTWRNEQAQQIVKSLCIWPDKRICRLCKDDITRLVKNPSHTPRWGEKCGVKCCMPGCDAPSFTQSKPSLWLPATITFRFFNGIGLPEIFLSACWVYFQWQIQSTRHTSWCWYRRK